MAFGTKILNPQRSLKGFGGLVLILVLASLPLFLDKFYIYIFAEIFVLALFAVSWNFLYRYSGMLSFGHGAYFAIGAYGYGLLMNSYSDFSFSLLLSLVGAALITALIAIVLGYICTRSTDIYFSILTLVLSMVVYSVLLQWRSLTSGDDGLLIIHRRFFFGMDFSDPARLYYWVLGVVVISILSLWFFTKSYYGHSMMGIRENPERAMFIGLPVRNYRLFSFVISAFFAGVAGALFAPLAGSITPTLAYWTSSAEPVLMAFIGGPTQFLGPVIGAGIYLLLKDAVMAHTEQWRFVLGVVFILVVLFIPGGILGMLGTYVKRRGKQRAVQNG